MKTPVVKFLLPLLFMIAHGVFGQYTYYRPVDINNTTGSTLTNYQVLVIFDTQTEIAVSKLQSSCADIRFTTSIGSTTYLNHWIERGCNTNGTRVWVKVPSLPTGTTTIYLYYNDPLAADASSGDNTFIFFDDFSSASLCSGALCASKWELKKESLQAAGGDSPSAQYSQNDNTVGSAFGQMRINSTNYPLPTENYALHFSFYDPGNVAGAKNIWAGFANASSTTPSDYLIAGLPMLDNTVLHYWYYFKTSSIALSPNYLTGGAGVMTSTRSNSWNQIEMYRRANSFGNVDFLTIRSGGTVTSTPAWFSSGVTPSYVTLYSTSYAGAFDNVFIRNYSYPDPTATVGSAVLPVELLSFNANLINNDDAELKWSTASELINDGFEIQKSADGLTFYKIAYVKGNGTTSVRHDYEFVDHNVTGRSYYKLKQWDWDGHSSYSQVQLVNAGNELQPSVQVSPNPIHTGGSVNFNGIGGHEVVYVEVMNMNGQPIKTYKGNVSEVEGNFQEDVINLTPGLYLIRASTSTGQLHCKFVKI